MLWSLHGGADGRTGIYQVTAGNTKEIRTRRNGSVSLYEPVSVNTAARDPLRTREQAANPGAMDASTTVVEMSRCPRNGLRRCRRTLAACTMRPGGGLETITGYMRVPCQRCPTTDQARPIALSASVMSRCSALGILSAESVSRP
jgi:hypothetical protein